VGFSVIRISIPANAPQPVSVRGMQSITVRHAAT